MKKSDNFSDKWGDKISKHGWVAVPSALLFAQYTLNLNSMELNVLLNLILHWWDKDKNPYPSQSAIARRMGVSVRTVQRTLADLVKKGIIEKQRSSVSNPVFKGRNVYNLRPLVSQLKAIDINFKTTEQDND